MEAEAIIRSLASRSGAPMPAGQAAAMVAMLQPGPDGLIQRNPAIKALHAALTPA